MCCMGSLRSILCMVTLSKARAKLGKKKVKRHKRNGAHLAFSRLSLRTNTEHLFHDFKAYDLSLKNFFVLKLFLYLIFLLFSSPYFSLVHGHPALKDAKSLVVSPSDGGGHVVLSAADLSPFVTASPPIVSGKKKISGILNFFTER